MATRLTALAVILLATVVLRLISQNHKLEKRIRFLEEILIGTEGRCWKCAKQEDCPAAFSGVMYPCKHFEDSHKGWRTFKEWKEFKEDSDEKPQS